MVAWLIAAAALLGHFGLHIAIYNRLNATGLARRTIKRTEKIFVASAVLVPIVVAWWMYKQSSAPEILVASFPHAEPMIVWYAVICLGSLVVLGIPWLLWRPCFGVESVATRREVKTVRLGDVLDQPLMLSRKCKWQSRIPGNQIFDLSIEHVDLRVVGLPAALDGLRIAHLSDLHLTGDIAAAFGKYVVDQATAWQPDLIVMTGDIVDQQPCIAWLADIFGGGQARFGCYFILGNHDTRVSNPDEVRAAMTSCGWIDVGGRMLASMVKDVPIEIIGNEAPWFTAPQIDVRTGGVLATPFRLLLSHSPDRIWWARRHGVGLMFAGHTHGGQGRLPLIGPVLSPSWHGSRFSSGDFFKAPTTLHVSRGLGGVHLLRIHCRPELSLVVLRSK